MKPKERAEARRINFEELRVATNGMLEAETYSRIHETAVEALGADGNILEVGAAHGTATIAIALALKDRTSGRRLFSFERATGGSRARFGGVSENVGILRSNLERYGVQDIVEIIVGDVAEKHGQAGGDGALCMLMLDADGMIDRDFELFYNRIRPGSPIVIDDCQEWVKLARMTAGKIRIDLKHLLTHALVSLYQDEGLLERVEVYRGTFFGRKPAQMTQSVDWSNVNVLPAYRRLVFSEGRVPGRLTTLARQVLDRHPKVKGWLRHRLGR